ncbi:MAG: hypothetical protein V7K27_13820 [Nostoc sp.]|uniref:hypothetical protein n=1 Tax=Nostoc sp. TaxID=1180 RepID=UPI002FFD5542
MNPQSILTLAKQGDANAIAALINNFLKGKRIIAKVTKKDDCLQVILESPEAPSQELLVGTIRKGLMSLALESIRHVKIYARQSQGSHVVWSERFSLTNTEAPKIPDFSPAMSAEASQELKKEARKREKEFKLVFWGFLIFLFGGCTIIGALSGTYKDTRDECYQRVEQELTESQGDRKVTNSDIQRAYDDFSGQCEQRKH